MPIVFNKINVGDSVGVYPPDDTQSFMKLDDSLSTHQTLHWTRDIKNGLIKSVILRGNSEEIIALKKLLTDEFSRCFNHMAYNILTHKDRSFKEKVFDSLSKVYAISEKEVDFAKILAHLFEEEPENEVF